MDILQLLYYYVMICIFQKHKNPTNMHYFDIIIMVQKKKLSQFFTNERPYHLAHYHCVTIFSQSKNLTESLQNLYYHYFDML